MAYLQVGQGAHCERHFDIPQMRNELAVFEALDTVVDALHMQLLKRFPDILRRSLLACKRMSYESFTLPPRTSTGSLF